MKPGRLYRSTRSETIWSDADEDAFVTLAPAHLHRALLLSLWTGRCQGDLLRMPWGNYDGSHIRLKQQKAGIRVVISVGATLKIAEIAMLTGHTLRNVGVILDAHYPRRDDGLVESAICKRGTRLRNPN